jgi:tetratricopeptide (TPR) repeat protein
LRQIAHVALVSLSLLVSHCKKTPPANSPVSESAASGGRNGNTLEEPVRLEPFHVRARPDKRGEMRLAVDAYDAGELFERADSAFTQKRLKQAVALYGQIRQEFPDSVFVPPALYNSGLAKEALGDSQGAIADYSALLENHPDYRDLKDALFRIAGAYEAIEAWGKAADTFSTILNEQDDLEGIERVEALVRKGAALIHLKKDEQAEESLELAVSLFRNRTGISPSESTYFHGMAQFKLGEIAETKMQQVALPADESELKPALEKKCGLLLDAQTEFTRAIRIAHPHWAAAAAYRIGRLYRVLWEQMLSAPVPEDLDGEEREIYTELLKERIRVLLKKAVRQWERVLKMASRLGLNNEWVERTRRDLDEVRRLLTIEAE